MIANSQVFVKNFVTWIISTIQLIGTQDYSYMIYLPPWNDLLWKQVARMDEHSIVDTKEHWGTKS